VKLVRCPKCRTLGDPRRGPECFACGGAYRSGAPVLEQPCGVEGEARQGGNAGSMVLALFGAILTLGVAVSAISSRQGLGHEANWTLFLLMALGAFVPVAFGLISGVTASAPTGLGKIFKALLAVLLVGVAVVAGLFLLVYNTCAGH
jgi:hypothetical protein